MPRNLSANAHDYAGPVFWGAKVTLADGAVHYFAGESFTFLGVTYQPHLRVVNAPALTRSLVVDSATLEFLNADLAVSTLIQSGPEASGFEGAECILSQLLVGVDEAIEILRGRLHEQEETEEAVRFRLVSDLDPAQRRAIARDYEAFCTWRFAKPPCGYDPAALSFTERLSEQTADIFSLTTVGKSTLSMTTNEHANRWVMIMNGTGKGQKRLIKSNTATTITILGRFATKPDATSKFRVFTFTNGAPKLILSSTGNGLEFGNLDIFSARTVGHTVLQMVTNEHKGDLVRIVSGTGSGQQRRIGSNTATTITIDAAEPDFSPAPDATSLCRVLYGSCPKSYSPACEERARNFAFNGFPTLTRELRRAFQPFELGAGGDGGGGVEG